MSRNIVLVHGAWADGSSWSKVIPLLQAAGHNVVAVQNQMQSLAGDSANTRAMIDAMSGPTVVVGHSYGGAVMTSAAAGASNVSGLVYIAGYPPTKASRSADSARSSPHHRVCSTSRPDPVVCFTSIAHTWHRPSPAMPLRKTEPSSRPHNGRSRERSSRIRWEPRRGTSSNRGIRYPITT